MPKPVDVTVVVPVRDIGDRLTALVRMLDGQDLRYDRYDVVFVDLGSSDSTAPRLATLVEHRPNVTLLRAPDATAGRRLAVDNARGEYTVLLSSRDRLQPTALSALLDRAADGELDLVLGRHPGPGPIGFVPDAVDHAWDAAADDSATAALAPLALIRTTLLRQVLATPSAGWRTDRIRLLDSAQRVAVLEAAPVASGVGPADGETAAELWADVDAAAELLSEPSVRSRFVAAHAAATPAGDTTSRRAEVIGRHVGDTDLGQPWDKVTATVSTGSVQWTDGVLQIEATATATVPGGQLPDGFDRVTPELVLQNASGSVGYRLPTDFERNDSADRVSFDLIGSLDVSTAADGAALGRGLWQLVVRLQGTGAGTQPSAPVPHTPTNGALIDGRPVAPFDEGGQFRIDVGAAKHGFLGRPKPADSSIGDSAAGTLLTLRLPQVAARGDAQLPGHLFLGKLALPATLISDSDGARITCHLSGLAGSSAVAARFAPAAKQSLGVQLRISAIGDMAVEAAAPPKPAAKPAAKPTAKSAAKPTAEPAAKPAPAAKKPAGGSSKPAAAAKTGSAGPAKRAASDKTKATNGAAGPKRSANTSRPYPNGQSQPLGRTLAKGVLPVFKPAGALLPPTLRRRARRAYRKLTR